MSEEAKSNKIIPGGLGCQGCGCIVILLLVIGSFIAGVKYSDDVKSFLDDIEQEFSGEVLEKVDSIKDKVQ